MVAENLSASELESDYRRGLDAFFALSRLFGCSQFLQRELLVIIRLQVVD